MQTRTFRSSAGWPRRHLERRFEPLSGQTPRPARDGAVLKPGGRLQIGDILVSKAVPASAKRDIDLWKGRIAGALLEVELCATVVAAGFVDFEITWRADVFSGAPQASSAAKFGTVGINLQARLPRNEEE